MSTTMEFSVVTLNCWGIRFVSKDRVARMTAIAEKLASENYDFVFLQEVWTTEDYERIRKRTKDNLPYGHYFYSGVIGAGLCILSKFQIKTAFFHQWAVNGYMHKIQHGDWFGGKGVGMVEADCNGFRVNLYTAHLHAEYDRKNDEYLAHRVIQSFDTAQFIRLTSRSADFVIVGGDLNTEPGDLAYKVIMHAADLQDAVLDVEKRALDELCSTCETPRISYTILETLKGNPTGKRIDYICFKRGKGIKAKTLSCVLPWPERVPGEPFSYSDHEAVVATFLVTKLPSETHITPQLFPEQETQGILRECVGICSKALMQLDFSTKAYGVLSITCFLILIMSGSVEFSGIFNIFFILLRVVTLLILVFGIIMGCVWNRMEINGILAGKLTMEIELGKFGKYCDFKDISDEEAVEVALGIGAGDQWDNNSTEPRYRTKSS